MRYPMVMVFFESLMCHGGSVASGHTFCAAAGAWLESSMPQVADLGGVGIATISLMPRARLSPGRDSC
jgi:hypothetical protein